GEVIRKVAAVPSSVAIQLLENFPNRGKGAAVRSGLLSATKPIAVFFDADLSTPIDELPKIVAPIARGEVDIAFGSRALNRKLIGNRQPWRREQGAICSRQSTDATRSAIAAREQCCQSERRLNGGSLFGSSLDRQQRLPSRRCLGVS